MSITSPTKATATATPTTSTTMYSVARFFSSLQHFYPAFGYPAFGYPAFAFSLAMQDYSYPPVQMAQYGGLEDVSQEHEKFWSSIVVEVTDSWAATSQEPQHLLAAKVAGRYWKVGACIQGYPIFKLEKPADPQAAPSDYVYNPGWQYEEDLFIHRVDEKPATGWWISNTLVYPKAPTLQTWGVSGGWYAFSAGWGTFPVPVGKWHLAGCLEATELLETPTTNSQWLSRLYEQAKTSFDNLDEWAEKEIDRLSDANVKLIEQSLLHEAEIGCLRSAADSEDDVVLMADQPKAQDQPRAQKGHCSAAAGGPSSSNPPADLGHLRWAPQQPDAPPPTWLKKEQKQEQEQEWSWKSWKAESWPAHPQHKAEIDKSGWKNKAAELAFRILEDEKSEGMIEEWCESNSEFAAMVQLKREKKQIANWGSFHTPAGQQTSSDLFKQHWSQKKRRW
jgi:hypothetical protein